MPQTVETSREDFARNRIADWDTPALAEGQVLLRIESFAVTSNNVTYAVVGDGFGYWNFFPAPEGAAGEWGVVPMWGHAVVEASQHPEVAVGERVYGYLPMATHLVVEPGKVSEGGFVDMAAHRQPMSPIYNSYTRLAADPEHDPARENERMIFGPLFKTGFLIEYFLRSEDWFGAERMILTSASSKTAMGLASVAKQRSPQIVRVGLTSAGNVDFVRECGLYDEVYSYDDIARLPFEPSVSVDFAGNPTVQGRLHWHLHEALKFSSRVGATHIDERGGALGASEVMPGPEPKLFFAPDHAVALFKSVGPVEAGKMMAESWIGFLGDVAGTVEMVERHGIDAAAQLFSEMVGGKVDPAKGVIIKP